MGFFNWKKKKEKILRKLYSAITVQQIGGVKWSEKDYENFAKEAYIKNVIAYRCIYEIAKAGAQVEWVVKRERNGKIEKVTDTQYNELIKRPNHDDSYGFLMMKAISYLKISGNTYMRKISRATSPDKEPLEMHIMRPDRMAVKIDREGRIVGYEYTQDNNQKKLFEVNTLTGESEILQVKEFHPTDDLYGLSPVEPGSYVIDTNNEATKWNMRVLQNEARIGLIYILKGLIDDEDYEQVQKNIKDFTGADNAGKSLVLQSEGGAEVRPYMWNPKEIDFVEGWRQTARATCFAFGVPSVLVGIPGDSSYANYKEARESLWEETNIFVLNHIKQEKNNWIFKENNEGLFIDYDTNKVSALFGKRSMLWERAQTSNFMTVNEKRNLVGLEDIQGGDVLLIPANMIPLGEGQLPPEPTKPEKQKLKKELGIKDDKILKEILEV